MRLQTCTNSSVPLLLACNSNVSNCTNGMAGIKTCMKTMILEAVAKDYIKNVLLS